MASSANTEPLAILTVGDGDFSASLAILRAYKDQGIIRNLVATTILRSKKDVIDAYPSSESILSELESEEYSGIVKILYHVDATKLDSDSKFSMRQFDLILFHYPHLGYTTNLSSQEHAERHSSLLAHYFAAALPLLTENRGAVHVCLSSGAAQTWKLHSIVEHLQLQYLVEPPWAASRPFLEGFFSSKELESKISEESSSKGATGQRQMKKRKGSGNRKGHWLGQFGYRHMPTYPQVTKFQTNVSNSYHYFMRPRQTLSKEGKNSTNLINNAHIQLA